jgi:DNA-binding transcriptional ArsR family regulator
MSELEKKKSNTERKSKDLLDDLKLSLEVMDIMDSTPRLRILLLLLIFQKLSLAQLSSLLGRSKATVTHHMKKFEKLDLLKISRKDARGSIDAKVYELNDAFFRTIRLNIEDIENLDSIKKEQVKDILHYFIVKDKMMFNLIKNFFQLSIEFYEGIDELEHSNSSFDFKNKYIEYPIDYTIWFLDEKGYKKYKNLISNFKEKMKEIITNSNEVKSYFERPYCILHTFFPLKEITKYDFDNKKFIEFLKIFD